MHKIENMTTQELLIGPHPQPPHIYGLWWNSKDVPETPTKKHRSLTENPAMRDEAINQLAQWVVDYHVHPHQLKVIEKKRAILDKIGLSKCVDTLAPLPTNDKAQKGNLGEIVLIEYLKETRGFTPIVHKLQYNPNTNQSMKGDDVLMFNLQNLNQEVIYGECKFRGEPSKKVICDIVENLEGLKRLPVSIEFVANRLDEMGNEDLANQITELHLAIVENNVPVNNVGFLISSQSATPSKDTFQSVEKHLSSTNNRLVMLSLGVDDPIQIVSEAFKRANAILKKK